MQKASTELVEAFLKENNVQTQQKFIVSQGVA
jgi:hypothetical protein